MCTHCGDCKTFAHLYGMRSRNQINFLQTLKIITTTGLNRDFKNPSKICMVMCKKGMDSIRLLIIKLFDQINENMKIFWTDSNATTIYITSVVSKIVSSTESLLIRCKIISHLLNTNNNGNDDNNYNIDDERILMLCTNVQ